jgi:hypothetical protein
MPSSERHKQNSLFEKMDTMPILGEQSAGFKIKLEMMNTLLCREGLLRILAAAQTLFKVVRQIGIKCMQVIHE